MLLARLRRTIRQALDIPLVWQYRRILRPFAEFGRMLRDLQIANQSPLPIPESRQLVLMSNNGETLAYLTWRDFERAIKFMEDTEDTS